MPLTMEDAVRPPVVERRRSGIEFNLTHRPLVRQREDVVERVAVIFKHPRERFDPPVEWHPHMPGTREHLWILDRDVVVQVQGIDEAVALHDMKHLAVEVAGPIKPRLVVEVHHVDGMISRASRFYWAELFFIDFAVC